MIEDLIPDLGNADEILRREVHEPQSGLEIRLCEFPEYGKFVLIWLQHDGFS
jgi:hypothetical protein